jgi:hypothetical protein
MVGISGTAQTVLSTDGNIGTISFRTLIIPIPSQIVLEYLSDGYSDSEQMIICSCNKPHKLCFLLFKMEELGR